MNEGKRMTSIYRTIRDFWRGYSIDDVASLRRQLDKLQTGDDGASLWLSAFETRALRAGLPESRPRVKVLAVDRGRAWITRAWVPNAVA